MVCNSRSAGGAAWGRRGSAQLCCLGDRESRGGLSNFLGALQPLACVVGSFILAQTVECTSTGGEYKFDVCCNHVDQIQALMELSTST